MCVCVCVGGGGGGGSGHLGPPSRSAPGLDELICVSQPYSVNLPCIMYLYNVIDEGASCSSVVSVRSWCDGSPDRPFMVDPLSYVSLQPVLHDWCNKGRG